MATKNLVPRNSGEGSLGSSSKPWASGYYDKLYITGAAGWTQITGAGGGAGDSSPLTTKGDLYGFTTENARIGTGANGKVLTVDSTQAAGVAWATPGVGSSLWSENGNKIYYNTDNVGIGTSDPSDKLVVIDSDAAAQTLAHFSGANTQANLVRLSSADGDIYLHAGYGGAKGGLYVPGSDASLNFNLNGDTILSITGNTVAVGNKDTGPDMIASEQPGLAIYGDTSTSHSNIALISTGNWGTDNSISFVNGAVGLGGRQSRWTVSQDNYGGTAKIASDLAFAYKTGAGPVDLSTDTKFILTSGGRVGIGISDPTAGSYGGGILNVVDTGAEQLLATFSGSHADSTMVMVEGGGGEQIFLQAGYGNSKGGGLYCQSDGSITFHTSSTLVAAITGSTFMIGNDEESNKDHIIADRPGLAIFGRTYGGGPAHSNIDLISTGFSQKDNTINFIEGSTLGGTNNRWVLGQDIGSSKSNLVMAYKTGDGAADLVTDARLTITDSGNLTLKGDMSVGTGDSWVTAQEVGGDKEFRISGELYITGSAGNWMQITGGGGGAGGSSPLTTKGDLYGFTTENARIGTGANGQVLTVDSTEAAGVVWATPGAGSSLWNQDGSTINYTAGKVGIGSSNFYGDALLQVSGTDTQLARFWNNSIDSSQIVLGHGNHPSRGLTLISYAPEHASAARGQLVYASDALTFSAGDASDLSMMLTGDSVTIGNASNSATPTYGPLGALNILRPDTVAGGKAQLNLISTGSIFVGGQHNNLINFMEDEASSLNNNKWTIGQVARPTDATDDGTSNLVIGHRTGDLATATNLTGSDALVTFAGGGEVGFGAAPVDQGGAQSTSAFQVYQDQLNSEIALFSGKADMNYLRVENGDNEGVYLTAGYGNTRGGGLASFYDASLTFHVGTNLVAAMTGTSFHVGNGAAGAKDSAMWEGAAMAVFGDTDTDPASINLISTGTNKNNNLINFREGSALGGTDNTWTIGQNVGSSKSDLVLAYKTGATDPELTGADAKLTVSDAGHILPGGSGTQNLGSLSQPWATGYFAGDTIMIGDTALRSDGRGLQVQTVGGGSEISGSTGTFGEGLEVGSGESWVTAQEVGGDKEFRVSGEFYITGSAGNWMQITGGGGGGGDSSPLTTKGDLYGFTTQNARIGTGANGKVLTVDSTQAAGVAWATPGAGSSLWSENGNKIYYNTDNVGIGASDPAQKLVVIDSDASHTTLAHFSGASTSTNLIRVSSADGDIYLHAGYGGAKGGLYAPGADGSIDLNVNGDTILSVTGDTVAIGNKELYAGIIAAERPGLVVYGDTSVSHSNISLVSTGLWGTDNSIHFINGSTFGGRHSRWAISQDNEASASDIASDLAFAYKTGAGEIDLATDTKFILSSGGHVGIGISDPAFPLHVSGTANTVMAKFEGDVHVGGDSTDNATLTVRHSGTIGHAPALSDYKNAAILITGYHPSINTPAILALDQNQMSYSSGQFNITAGSVGGDGGGSITLSSTPPNKAPSTEDKTLKVFNSGVGIAANATSEAQFASNPNFPAYPLHVSGTPNTVMAKFEGDVNIGGDSADNATLRLRHSGTMGSASSPKFENAALLINSNDRAANDLFPYMAFGFDNNQIMWSGGASNIGNNTGSAWPMLGSGPWYGPGKGLTTKAWNTSVENVHGPMLLGASSYSGSPNGDFAPSYMLRLADRRVSLGSAASFSADCTLHVSGGLTGADGGLARFDGDVRAERLFTGSDGNWQQITEGGGSSKWTTNGGKIYNDSSGVAINTAGGGTFLDAPSLVISGNYGRSATVEFVGDDSMVPTLPESSIIYRQRSSSIDMQRWVMPSGNSTNLEANAEYIRCYAQAPVYNPATAGGIRGSLRWDIRDGNLTSDFNTSLRLGPSGISCGEGGSVNNDHPYGLYVGGKDAYIAQDLHVNGELTATTKTFLIDHPSQEGKTLRHGCLEGPEHGVYVRGKLENNSIIALPDYWVDLVDADSITCQLTPLGAHQNLYIKSIGSNQITVGSDEVEINCHYLVQAERKDVDKITVEQ